MNDYRPTLDDIETLVTDHPDKFTSPLQTRRSIDNARGQGVMVEDITAQAQYGDYISKGGTPIGPGGQMPAAQTPASDQQFATPCAVCAAAGGCCIKGITFGCAHADGRMTLPLADDTKDRVLAIVCDKEANPTVDEVKIEVDHAPNANCCMTGQVPTLTLNCDPPVTVSGTSLNTKMQHEVAGESYTGTDLELFMVATAKSLWSGVNSLGRDNRFSVSACGGGDQWGAIVRTFPKLEWKATAFSFEVTGKFDTAMRFTPGIKLEGKVEGTYGSSTFNLGASGGPESDPQNHTKSIVPFLDRVLGKMEDITSGGASTPELNTRSSIQISHKFSLGNSTFKLVENPNDHSKIGVDGSIWIGYDPLLKIGATLDIIDLVLTIASRTGAPGIADMIIKARESMARGIGNKDGPLHARGHVGITLEIYGEAGKAGVTLTRGPTDDKWTGSGEVSGAIGTKLKAQLVAEGKAVVFKGAFKAEGGGASEISAAVKTLAPGSASANSGNKLNVKVEWNGLKLYYHYQVQATILGFIDTGVKEDVGELQLFDKETLYDEDM